MERYRLRLCAQSHAFCGTPELSSPAETSAAGMQRFTKKLLHRQELLCQYNTSADSRIWQCIAVLAPECSWVLFAQPDHLDVSTSSSLQ